MTIENENEPVQPDTTPVDLQEAGMSAIDRALEDEGGDGPKGEPETEAPVELAEEGQEPEVEGAEDAVKPDTAEAAKVAKDNEPDAALEDEIKGLGLKDKASERFRDMAGQIRELAPVREALEKAGVKDLAELPKLIEHASAATDMIAMVTETGATAEQYGMTLDYLSVHSKAMSGDPKAAEQVWEMWQSEGRELAKVLGKEMPGIHDPLEDHADLAEAIESGDMTRKHALEVAKARTIQSNSAQRTQAVNEQQVQVQATEQAKGQIGQYDQHMLANDPTYAAKRDQLSTMVSWIRENLPPGKWLEATQQAYQRIPNPVPAAPAAKTRAPVGPVRPSGPRPTMAAAPENPMDAIEAGLAAAGQ